MRAALGTALLLAGSAGAQGLDFTRQDVAVDLTGPSPTIDLDLDVTATAATTTFEFLIPPSDVQTFEVGGVAVTPLAHPQYPKYLLQVKLPTALAAGQSAHLHARLGGAMRCATASGPPACFTGAERTLLLPVSLDAAWYFVNLYQDTDPFEGDVKVRAPAAQTVLAGAGAGTVVDLGDGTRRWTYSLGAPMDMEFLAAGTFSSVEAAGPYTVRAYFPAGVDVQREQRIADLGAQVLPIYGRLFGDLPVRQAHFITVPSSFPAAGMGLLANVFIADYVFGDTYGYLLEQGAAHELAHSWWGNLSSGAGDERAFMSEAFAEYSAWRALGEAAGADAVRTSGMRMNAVWYMYRTPVGADVAPLSAGVTEQPGYVYVTYHKGPLALRAMEEVAGAEAFTAGLEALVALGPGKTSMAALVEKVKAAGGGDLGPEVAQWLRQAGFPRAVVTPSLDAGTLKLSVQSSGPFSYRLPVRARLAGGRVVEQVLHVTEGATVHTVPLSGDVETVELDPAWTLPREVKAAVAADVTFDGAVDGRDLLEVSVRVGGTLPTQRRVDGRYDPLYDIDASRTIDVADLEAVLAQAQ